MRDLLIGLEPKDFDVATDALPEQVKKLFRNCRLVGRRFRLAHVFFGREIIEVATFRAASAPSQGEEPLPDADPEDGEAPELEVVAGEQGQCDEALQCCAEVAAHHRRQPVHLAGEREWDTFDFLVVLEFDGV